MDGYSVTEAASVLGVPTERVWELLARGVLSGHPEGDTGMRVFLQPRPGPPVADPSQDRPRNGNGGTPDPTTELSPFRELLTEFRNLTERYGQALLALGEARGEVASLRSRVDVLEARMDLRLPTSVPPASWPYAPTPAPRSTSAFDEADAVRSDFAEEVAAAEEAPRRRRRSGRPDVTEIAEALARANDPSPPELPEVHPATAEEPHVVAEAEPQAGVVAEPEPVELEPDVIAVESESAFEPEPVAAEAEEVAAEAEEVAAEAETVPVEPDDVEPGAVDALPEAADDDAQAVGADTEPEVAEADVAATREPDVVGDGADSAVAAIAPDESLQADGDWPAAAPTIDVADPEPVVATEAEPVTETQPVADAEPVTETEPVADAIEAAYDEVPPPTAEAEPEPSVVEPVTVADVEAVAAAEPEAMGEVTEPVTDAIGVAGEDVAPIGDAASIEPAFESGAESVPAEAAATAEPPVDAEDDAGFVDTAPVDLIEGSFEAASEAPVAEQVDDSPYRATLEEPDWLSEDDMGMPSEPPADDRWGSTEPPAGAGRASWSLWDAEPSPAPQVEPPAVAEPAVEEAPAATPAPERRGAPAPHADEEPVLWLGAPSESDAGSATDENADAAADEADDAAAEMEVAATGWHPADREGAPSARREWRATELPGSQELEDALASLRRMVGGRSGNDEPDARPAEDSSSTPPDPTPSEAGDAGPAQRAYARLRRILPR